MSNNCDETIHLQSGKRQKWIRETRGEKLQRHLLQRALVALPVWSAHQPRHSLGETSVRGLIVPDRTGGERRQFMPDLPQGLR